MQKNYRIFYDGRYRADILDWTEDIKASTSRQAMSMAEEFIKEKNLEAQRGDTRHSYTLTKVCRVAIRARRVRKEKLTLIGKAS